MQSESPPETPTADSTRPHGCFGEPFRPRRFLTGGHAQTIAGNFLPRRNLLPTPEERLFSVEPGVQVHVPLPLAGASAGRR